MYAITATITWRYADGSSRTRDVPTFYLSERVQGIVSADHAVTIAETIIDPFGQYEVSAYAMSV